MPFVVPVGEISGLGSTESSRNERTNAKHRPKVGFLHVMSRTINGQYKALSDRCACINQRIKAAKHVATFCVI